MLAENNPSIEKMFHSSYKHHQEGAIAIACMHALYGLHLSTQSIPAHNKEQKYSISSLPTLEHYSTLLKTAKRHAFTTQTRAYAPYSGFQVGATLMATDGTLWSGCNVESSSYGLTLCAERAALATAVAHGKRHFAAIVVATSATPPSSPCGACRQLLYEFAPDAIVLRINTHGEELWTTMQALLPDAFSLHPPQE